MYIIGVCVYIYMCREGRRETKRQIDQDRIIVGGTRLEEPESEPSAVESFGRFFRLRLADGKLLSQSNIFRCLNEDYL